MFRRGATRFAIRTRRAGFRGTVNVGIRRRVWNAGSGNSDSGGSMDVGPSVEVDCMYCSICGGGSVATSTFDGGNGGGSNGGGVGGGAINGESGIGYCSCGREPGRGLGREGGNDGGGCSDGGGVGASWCDGGTTVGVKTGLNCTNDGADRWSGFTASTFGTARLAGWGRPDERKLHSKDNI